MKYKNYHKLLGNLLTGLIFILLTEGPGKQVFASSAELPPISKETLSVVREAYVYLHQNPELGKKEFAAKKFIQMRLEALGNFQFYTVSTANTAVIAVLDSGRPGKTIALRAELDGRKLGSNIVEPESHDPRSLIPGLMHNCGHDAHAAMLLGAALHIQQNLKDFYGKIVFVFQPAEETKGGADDIINSNVLQRLGVDAIFAQHVVTNTPVGVVTISPGTPLAGSNYFWLTLRGQASHAAQPYRGSDLAVVASKIILELTHFPARQIDIGNRPMIISVTGIKSNTNSRNSIASEIKMGGTIRAFEDIFSGKDGQQSITSLLKRRINKLAVAYGVEAEWEISPGSPPTTNSDKLYTKLTPKLREVLGSNLKIDNYRGMFSEDFSFYTQSLPALYFGLGIAKDGLGTGAIHSPQFTLHPDALIIGTQLLVSLVKLAQ